MSYIQSHPYATHHPAAPTPDQPSRNPSTSTSTTTTPSVSRRIIIDPVGGYEREETREERRNRKDKERQQRSNQTGLPLPESHGSPNSIPTSQPRQRPSQSIASSSSSSRPSISSPPLPSSSSSNSTNNPSTSSKSVLTIALQRAQSAVLLDSANNFPAAISAYSQSVRLLKEVMARVETKGGASEMERKASQGSVMSLGGGRRDSESVEEWEKRKARWEKKEKAKIDEARRLKVIHDTYEDRIKMLLTMNPSLASAASPSLAAAVLPSTSSATTPATTTTTGKNGYVNQSGESSPTTAASSPSMRFHRRRSSTELPSSPQFQQQGHRSKPSTSSLNSTGPTSPSLIGQAMLSSTPSSPQSQQSHSSNIPRIAQLPLSTSHPTSLQHLSSQDPSFLNPSLRERPLSTASDSTAKGISPYSGSVTPTTSQPLPPPSSSLPLLPPPPAHQMSRTNSLPPPPSHPPPPIPSQRTDRQGSDSSLDDPIPVTALEEPSFDWPSSSSNHSSPITSLPIITSSSLLTQTQTTPPRPSAPTRQNSIPLLLSSSTFPSTNSSPMRRGSSASAVYTQSTLPTLSNPSKGSRSGSLSGNENGMMMRRTMSSEGGGGNVLRPMRSASLAGQGQLQAQGGFFSSGMVPSLSTGSNSSQQTQTSSQFSIGQYGRLQQREQEEGLVSDSTKGGTISQRRLEGREGGQQQRELEATIVVRAPSSESHRTGTELQYDEFGAPAAATESRGFAGRLRALSQPGNGGKRPTLDSISPPVPPLLTQIPSNNSRHLPSLSLSSSSASNQKKSSVPPTPTSLFPSSNLGRSNSSSSVGSSTSGRYSDRSLPPPLPSHHAPAPSTLIGIPSPPNRTSASSRETISSIQPVRRPFHLMRLILATMPTSPSNPSSRSSVISLVPSHAGGGGYLSEKLFVPSQVWSIPGSKLISLDSKLRSMELLLSSLVTLNQAGQSLLSPALANTALSSGVGGERWVLEEAKRFGRELEGFEGVLEGVQNTLSKKLGGLVNPTGGGIGSIINGSSSNNGNGNGVGGGTGGGGEGKEFGVMEKGGREMGSLKDGMMGGGRKGSTAGGQFASWSSKFQRGLDRVTNSNSVSLDSQATYVETIARLFKSCQCIDHHLSLLLSSSSSDSQDTTTAYTLLPLAERHRLERQLRRASEFFGTVVCRFVMKDLGMLLDKYVKRGGAWLSGE